LNRPVVWIPLAAVVVALIVWVLPSLLTREPDVRGAEQHKAIADVRTGLIAMLVALGAVGGLSYTARTYRLAQIAQLTGRFQDASKQLGEEHPTVRLAGLYAMAQLADEWTQQRQTCVDVLCAYLRASREPQDQPEQGGGPTDQDLSVRRAAVGIIASRLRTGPKSGWHGCDFDFTEASMDVGDFGGVSFLTGRFTFDRVRFSGPVSFDGARFAGAAVSFRGAIFEAQSEVTFHHAHFTAGSVTFDGATFSGGAVRFTPAELVSPCRITFEGARLGAGGSVLFDGTLRGPEVSFAGALFVRGAGEVSFAATFVNRVSFDGAEFHRTVRFDGAVLSGAELSFEKAKLDAGGTLTFVGAQCAGASFLLGGVVAMGGRMDLTGADGTPDLRGTEQDELSWLVTNLESNAAGDPD